MYNASKMFPKLLDNYCRILEIKLSTPWEYQKATLIKNPYC